MSDDNQLAKCGCQQQGLTIFPARYTVVPTYIKKNRPAWANLPGVTDVKLDGNYQYHIRRMRMGFIYIYLPSVATTESLDPNLSEEEKMELESQHWLIYSIDEKGFCVKNKLLKNKKDKKDKNDKNADSSDSSFHCPDLLANETAHTFISIPYPQRYSKVYIAYSEFPWTVEAMQEYRKSPLPRMQELDVKAWLAGQQQQSATVATTQTLGQILDFDFDFTFNNTTKSLTSLLYNEQHLVDIDMNSEESQYISLTFDRPLFEKVIKFESPVDYSMAQEYGTYPSDYSFELKNKPSMRFVEYNDEGKSKEISYRLHTDNIKLNTTPHPWCNFKLGNIATAKGTDSKPIFQDIHNVHLQTLHKNMQKYSGANTTPMILALEDALGVAEELNNYYNDIFGHLTQFKIEAEMELDVKTYVQKLYSYIQVKETQPEQSIAPYNDEYYKALQAGKDIDDLAYQQGNSINDFDKQYGHLVGEDLSADVASAIKAQVFNDNLSNIHAPAKREMYRLVNSYILLVKNHFYDKPYGRQYYDRFMSFLKTGQESGFVYNDGLGNDIYGLDSIYYYLEKYKEFKTYNPVKEQQDLADALTKMHLLYTKLVNEYQSNAEIHQNALAAQIETTMQKDFLSRLDTTKFDQVFDELNKHLILHIEPRSKQLTDWLENSHYLQAINDLSFVNHIELSTLNNAKWLETYQPKWQTELQEALDKKEITTEEAEKLNYYNLNGHYFSSVMARSLQGLELSKENGKQFLEKMMDLSQLEHVNPDSRLHIKQKFRLLALRAIVNDYQHGIAVLKNAYELFEKNKDIIYDEDVFDFNQLVVDGLKGLIVQIRQSSLILECFCEIRDIKKIALVKGITINTTFGPKYIRFITDFSNIGILMSLKLACYDKLVRLCNKTTDRAIHVGLIFADMLTKALSGAIWASIQTYQILKYQLYRVLLTVKDKATQLFKGRLSLGYNAKTLRLIAKLRQSLNTATANLDIRYATKLQKFEQTISSLSKREFYFLPDTSLKNGVSLKTIARRNMVLALIVGMLELYSWSYLMDKEAGLLTDDTALLQEKISITMALVAAITDIVATTVKVIKGENLVFAYAKSTFGIFAGVASLTSSIRMFQGASHHVQVGNSSAAMLGFLSGSAYAISGGSLVMAGLSYRYKWVHTFYRQRLAKLFKKIGLKQLIRLSAASMRMILYRFFGIFGFLAVAMEFLYALFADNEIQDWLSFSALGVRQYELKYTTAIEQRRAYQSIAILSVVYEQLSAEITAPIDAQLSEQSEEIEQTLEHTEIMLQVENYITQQLPAI